MNWLVMKLVFMTIPTQPMPFFIKPIASAICKNVMTKLIDPNLDTARAFMEAHLGSHRWFAGDEISMADFQMSFAVDAALSRGAGHKTYPHLLDFKQRMEARPAYQRALEKGGPTVVAF